MWNLFQRKTDRAVRAAPDGVRIYAVGDVHGRLDALDVLLDAMGADMAKSRLRPVLVMLGDYVDRGPASRGVIERLVELSADPEVEARFIRGNHDDTMMRFATDASVGPTWCGFGGGETLQSYGVAAPHSADDAQAWVETQTAFRQALPVEHLGFLRGLEPSVEYGGYFFAHAGARPGVALDGQELDDLMWIREEFLRSPDFFPKVVVHGHTPEEEPFVSDRRIGVDTGAYATGRLTAVVLEGAEQRLIQAQVVGGRARIEHFSVGRPS